MLFDGPADARDAGIAIIYQEPILFPDLTVEENIFIGRQPLAAGRRIDRREMRKQVAEVFERLGVRLDPARIARGLSIAEQQIVEIAKALSLDAKVIVMDEPTAALSGVEVERLFGVVESLRAAGRGVLFISHRLEEIFALCQRGHGAARRPLGRDASLDGADRRRPRARDGRPRALGTLFPKRTPRPARRVLQVERLSREGVFNDISFEVRAGEIVALAGLVGAGRSEVAWAIFGIDRYDAGSVDASTAGACAKARRPPRWRPGSASSRRTGASRAS